jgi:putative transposase
MPRAIRIQYPGAHYHAMCRGNNGQDIFENDDGRRLFLSTLDEVCQQTGWLIHAYVLMSNHYHLLLETPEANLVAGMKWFQGAYTQRFNAMFKRRGHLYQGRYKAIPIGTDPQDGGLEYFREVSTYIHLNPFRAKVCGEGLGTPLEQYKWSSYPAYCGRSRKEPKWLVREKVLKTWGLKKGEPGCDVAYREKLERFMRFEEDPLAGMRGEFDKQIKRGWFIGTESYRKKLEEKLRGKTKNDNYRGGQREDHGPSEAERLWLEGLQYLGIVEAELLSAKSTRMEKQALAWLIKKNTSVTGNWIADRLEMGHPSTASKAINRFARDKSRQATRLRNRLLKRFFPT